MEITEIDFQVFIKPIGPICNLACTYCYYHDKSELFPDKKSYLMPDEILEQYIIQQIEATEGEVINFSWHGGEPTLAGLDYFKKIVRIQKEHQPKGKRVLNGIQTNGTLLNEDWCEFLAKENFTVGISLDGTEDLNDRYRKTADRKSTFQKIIRGYRLIRKYHITHEILCVVHEGNVGSPLEVYRFFKELGATYLSFLPLVIADPQSLSGVKPPSVSAKEFGVFLSRIFDEWVSKDIGTIKIQLFEEVARLAFKQDHTLCILKKTCGKVPVIEHTGDFYSCDHFVDPEHYIGNIMQRSLSDLINDERQKEFGRAKETSLPNYCRECEVLAFCNGGCPKNRLIRTPDGKPGLNYLCEGYKLFFNHCRPFVDALSEVWKHSD